ncbi:DUF3119 family protein [Gloeobacter kilaueensis]|uniref:Glycerol dehydrogenase n=1 Tax=Gloeobacter kilaueensis (strain ATCC BAA-2537 / CCAP 1431/1 / ULC 316 / JS1) TaxID=1183438 RepID=U5QIH3_GLOK1|nr:DUF3119 family protein [Gloeobacter kilaueensis]AGY57455.1 hypothetical protein GKIL_1209 [Gloeobacter kilaueensis JS1]
MFTDPFAPPPSSARVVSPRPWLSLAVIVLGLLAVRWILGIGLLLVIFGLFLGFQTATVRLVFAAEAFEVWQYRRRVVSFPYKDWLSWKIFWPGLPILFYFREVYSPHFIPMLFDEQQLRLYLEQFLPQTVRR